MLVITVGVAATMLGSPSRFALAKDGPDKPVIDAEVTDPGSEGDGRDGGAGPIPCTWFDVGASPDRAAILNHVQDLVVTVIGIVTGSRIEVTITYYSVDGELQRWSEGRGRFEKHQRADCRSATDPGGVETDDTRWVRVTPPDPGILVPDTTRRAIEPIDLPAPDINPPARSAVNLGLWLAVEPVGPIVARAELGPLWAETTATLVSTTFDPGNGDGHVVCDGVGTPIPASRRDEAGEGPCGYTYRDVPDGPVSITVTSRWTVTWEESDGDTGSRPDIVVTTVVPYEVYEIQTVGSDR